MSRVLLSPGSTTRGRRGDAVIRGGLEIPGTSGTPGTPGTAEAPGDSPGAKYAAAMTIVCGVGATTAAADPAPLIPPGAEVQTVTTGYKFTEGPALAPDGSIYFTDIPNNAIHRYDPATGETTLFTGDSGGANGLTFFRGQLFACAGRARALQGYEARYRGADPAVPADRPSEDGSSIPGLAWDGLNPQPSEEAMVDTFDGKRLNSPNDLVITDDAVYFTDPRYGNRDGMEQSVEGVYALTRPQAGAMKPYQIERVIDDLVRPNGIAVSPDQQTLYVCDHGGEKLYAYAIEGPGMLGERRLVVDTAEHVPGGPDGMTVDAKGRLYTAMAGKGQSVLIVSPEGEKLGVIATGPQTTNCTFAADGKTLYITAEKSLKRITLNVEAE